MVDGPETVIALSVVASNSGPIAESPPLSLPPPILSSISWPAPSKNINCFLSASALSPSKNTFTVGKTNTDKNEIEFGEFFLYPKKQASWNWSYLNILSLRLVHFHNVDQNIKIVILWCQVVLFWTSDFSSMNKIFGSCVLYPSIWKKCCVLKN